jgi:hypothetical protein
MAALVLGALLALPLAALAPGARPGAGSHEGGIRIEGSAHHRAREAGGV